MPGNENAATAVHDSIATLTAECTPAPAITSDESVCYSREEIRPIIKACVQKALDEFDKQYEEKLAALHARLTNAEETNKQLREKLEEAEKKRAAGDERMCQIERKLEEVQKELSAKKISTKNHEIEINDLEQYSRRSHIRIRGLNMQHGESYKAAVARLCSTQLGVQIKEEDLDAAHPLPQAKHDNRNGQQKQQRPPTMIARFHRRDQRDDVIRARSVLKDSGIVVSEDMTKKNQDLLHRLFVSKQYTSSWSWMGKIYAIPRGETKAKRMSIHDTIDTTQ